MRHDVEWLADLVAQARADGALAVVLTGSVARGEAQPESDVDLLVLGHGPEYRLLRDSDRLISISWSEAAEVRRAFGDPRQAGFVVPGWRDAVLLDDPSGIAQELVQAAKDWSWDRIGAERCNAWVAEELCGYAEEVHKLINALELGAWTTAAIQRNVLAARLAIAMSVHLRLLYDSENRLWDLVSDQLGEPWRNEQAQAFGFAGEQFEASCQAALRLYALACRVAWDCFDARQRMVIEHAIALFQE